jgi:hypothetical protein
MEAIEPVLVEPCPRFRVKLPSRGASSKTRGSIVYSPPPQKTFILDTLRGLWGKRIGLSLGLAMNSNYTSSRANIG